MRFLVVLFVAFLLLVATAYSGVQVVIDSLHGAICGDFVEITTTTQVISICNPDETQFALTIAFDIVSPEGSAFTIEGHEFYNGFELPPIWVPYEPTFDVTPIDNGYRVTISAECLAHGPDNGLRVSSDTIPCIGIQIRPAFRVGGSICVDSSGEWSAWSGPVIDCSEAVCRAVGPAVPNCCLSYISNCPQIVTTPRLTDPATYDFFASEIGDIRSVRFRILSGPGEIVDIGMETGRYMFHPGPEDAGQSYEVTVLNYDDWCGDGSYMVEGDEPCTFTVTVGDDDPATLFPYPEQNYVAITGEQLAIPLYVTDDGPNYDYSFDWWVDPPMTKPSGAYIDPTGPTFYYTGQSADTGRYVVRVVLHEGSWADTVGFAIWHFEDFITGDCNHSGDVTIGDIGWLVSYLFITGLPPAPPESGNVNCEPGITIGDIGRMVDHLFLTQSPLCDPRQ